MKKLLIPLIMALVIAIMGLPGLALAQGPPADYGDAPDPTYPSLFASGGPFHLNVSDSYIGPSVGTTTTETDARVPDLDQDDGNPILFVSYAPGGFWAGWINVPITYDLAFTGGDRYLNVLLDDNSNGMWSDAPGEWIVRNHKISPADQAPGSTVHYNIGGFPVTNFGGMHWVRITLSEQKIAANAPFGWDGSDPTGGNGFAVGETEDWELSWYAAIPPAPPPFPQPPAPTPPGVPPIQPPKAAVVYQVPPPVHIGHQGTYGVWVANIGAVAVTITAGPWKSNQWGDPCTILVNLLAVGTVIPVGGTAITGGSWQFWNSPPNHAGAKLNIRYNQLDTVTSNVGTYIDDTSDYANGIECAEQAPHGSIPGITVWGAMVAVMALGALAIFMLRRRRTYHA